VAHGSLNDRSPEASVSAAERGIALGPQQRLQVRIRARVAA